MADSLPFSQSCENNRQPILEQLGQVLTEPATVLEIGTGTGQHAEYIASRLPYLHWLPTDHPDNLWMCRQRLEQADLANIDIPRVLDVGTSPWQLPPFDHAFTANTTHIMAWEEVCRMVEGVAERLSVGGRFCLYGPFNYHGAFTSDSNRDFDHYLRARAGHMGLRDIDHVIALASARDMELTRDEAMPANNRFLVLEKVD